MPADRMSGDRVPTAEEAEVLAWAVASLKWDPAAVFRLVNPPPHDPMPCVDAGWMSAWDEEDGSPIELRLLDSGRAALARYRAAHGEGQG